MAPGKKRSRINNKKKDKAGRVVPGSAIASNGDHSASILNNATNAKTTKRSKPFSEATLDEINWDDFGPDYQQKRENQPELRDYRSIYLRYKEATLRFKDGLRSMVPDEIFQGDYVQCFIDAVDYLKDNNVTEIPNYLMVDLKLAIRVRKRVSDTQFSGSRGD